MTTVLRIYRPIQNTSRALVSEIRRPVGYRPAGRLSTPARPLPRLGGGTIREVGPAVHLLRTGADGSVLPRHTRWPAGHGRARPAPARSCAHRVRTAGRTERCPGADAALRQRSDVAGRCLLG